MLGLGPPATTSGAASPASRRLQTFNAHTDGHFIHHEEPAVLQQSSKPFRGPQTPFSGPARLSGTPPRPGPHPVGPQNVKRRPQFQANPPPPAKQQDSPSEEKQVVAHEGPGGCHTKEGFYFAGQKWYVKGCRRRTCIHFRGSFITETDSCDSEIFNTTYKCIVQVDTTAQYPDCCPTYRCNPDNLGNSVK
ncbi:uncharacterized protein [Panulirus ornatus]|uniref:uncharacterized protein n=1 Tax=Panulirus ornatus TaxID=150431 RepID=UPI003A844AD2